MNQPVIAARYVANDLHVTDLQSDEWQQTQAVSLNRYWSGEAAPANRHAEARLLWSNDALHVRFVCHQQEPLIANPNPQTEKKTKGLWDRDVCEIFIAPDANVVEHYYELEAAPTGEWLDVAINWKPEKREADWEFRSEERRVGKEGRSRWSPD